MDTNILIVGHNKAMNYILKTVLGKHGKLVIVNDVFQAINIMRMNQDIGLIILDIDFQTSECMDFIKHLGSSKIYNKPVIVLSSLIHIKNNEPFLQAHVYEYFTKPFNPIEFSKSVNRLNQLKLVGQS